jgi:hypothetical protein
MSQEAATPVSPIRAAVNELEGDYQLLEPAGLDAAIVGLVAAFGDEYGVIGYDRDAVIDILVADGMSRDEAEGFVANVLATGDDQETPRFITSAKSLMATHKAPSVREAINEIEGSFLLLEPAAMDEAIAGLLATAGKSPVICYDRDLVIESLMKDGMDRDEAEEFFSFNVEGAYMGEATPVYLTSTKTLIDQVDLVN